MGQLYQFRVHFCIEDVGPSISLLAQVRLLLPWSDFLRDLASPC